tara:strand:+ start:62530 stop:62763 length:234 start_codon:yes stop_codon:yes gene_type:complete
MNKKRTSPKDILFTESENSFYLRKKFTSKKLAPDPYLITNDLDEAVNRYLDDCKKWNINPNRKMVLKLIAKHAPEEK